MKKVKYSWEDLESDYQILVRKIRRSKFNPATIIGMARGGLTISVKLSHRLHKPLMIVSCKTYDNNSKSMNTALLNSSYTVPLQSPVLIVDEIADSGKTLNIVAEHFKSLGVDVRTATLLYKKHSITKPNYYVREVGDDSWTIFPWEV